MWCLKTIHKEKFLLVVAVLVFVNLVKNKIKLTLKQCGALGHQPHCAAENQLSLLSPQKVNFFFFF